MKKQKLDNLTIEREYQKKGYKLIAGTDEVGRGPLAGPVVCAAVIMPLDNIIDGVDDSKKLTEKKRNELSKKIIDTAISYSICQVSVGDIDEINILNATKKCMTMCIESLDITPDIVFTDAVKLDIETEQLSIIKGDSLSYSVAAASIIAKVYRDSLMTDYDALYPDYCFASNKGYGSRAHIQALKEIGPCKIHRKTFIKNYLDAAEK